VEPQNQTADRHPIAPEKAFPISNFPKTIPLIPVLAVALSLPAKMAKPTGFRGEHAPVGIRIDEFRQAARDEQVRGWFYWKHSAFARAGLSTFAH